MPIDCYKLNTQTFDVDFRSNKRNVFVQSYRLCFFNISHTYYIIKRLLLQCNELLSLTLYSKPSLAQMIRLQEMLDFGILSHFDVMTMSHRQTFCVQYLKRKKKSCALFSLNLSSHSFNCTPVFLLLLFSLL